MAPRASLLIETAARAERQGHMMLAGPARFKTLMERLGTADGHPVTVGDGNGPRAAAPVKG